MFGNSGGVPPGDGSYSYNQDPHTHDTQAQAAGRVKVEDALSYLDQVKTQFSDEPAVYSQFLDIMKDFKSQAIDTPGVIRRVSHLFKGRPFLIMGFNTFLPPGFEVNITDNTITISEPSGNIQVVCEDRAALALGVNAPAQVLPQQPQTPIVQIKQEREIKSEDRETSVPPPPPMQNSLVQSIRSAQYAIARSSSAQSEISTQSQQIASQIMAASIQQSQLQTTPPRHEVRASPSTVPALTTPPNIAHTENPGFNQALGYVNKIKVRFSEQPYVYKHFLDILTNFQKQMQMSRNNAASERYILDAIGELFKNEPDLLDEFRYFLPEAVLVRPAQESSSDEEDDEDDDIGPQSTSSSDEESEQEVKEEPTEAESERAERNERRTRAQKVYEQTPGAKKRHITRRTIPAKRRRIERNSIWKRSMNLEDVADKLSPNEIEIFEKIKRVLTPKRYQNFCRGLNLYTSKLISEEELHSYIKQILGGVLPDLVNWFGLKLGISVERGVEGEVRREGACPRINSELAHEIDYNSCKRLGLSYRALPDSYKRPPCSGRTQLCKEVLNDTWVSFPSWLSEDSSNVSSKKSIYEEYVYRTEDDRFELDIILEVNKYAMDAFEGLLRTLKRKKQSEQDAFRLDDSLGASSPSIMQRAIKRVYGEAAFKITEGLKKNPVGVIPRVVERLKQKQIEWTEAQKHMNVIWRENSEKYMTRSMDHQSNAARALDAKWMRAKTIIHQIECLFDERQSRSLSGEVTDEGPHMVLMYPEDRSVIHDAAELILHHLRKQTNVQKDEKARMKEVVRKLIPELFGMDAEPDSDVEEPHGTEGKRRTRQNIQPRIERLEPVTLIAPDVNENKIATTYRMIYGANPLFVLLRLHGMVCERLGKLKSKCREMLNEHMLEVEVHKKREEYYKKYGKSVMGQEINSADPFSGLNVFKSPRVNPEKHYAQALVEVKHLMDGTTEQTAFEDNVRNLFPADLHLLVMLDKFVGQMCKQLHQLVVEEEPFKSLETYKRYKMNELPKFFSMDENRIRIETEYGEVAEKALNCHNCFKVVITHEEKGTTVAIELVDTETDPEEAEVEIEKKQEERTKKDNDSRKLNGDDEEAEGSANPATPAPTYLKRNMKRRIANGKESCENMHERKEDMIRLDPYSPVIKPNFTLLMKKKQPRKTEKMKRLEIITKKRSMRIRKLWAVNEGYNIKEWLEANITRVFVYDINFPFLEFNRYTSNPPPKSVDSSE